MAPDRTFGLCEISRWNNLLINQNGAGKQIDIAVATRKSHSVMPAAALPANEIERLAKLKSYGVLDTLAEEAFDEITRFAALLCETPISLISLVDQDRQWFKSAIGLTAAQTPRSEAVCAHAILQNEVFEISDARTDERISDSTLVWDDPFVTHYAGMPLTTDDGFNIGTLCVIDRKPGKLTKIQKAGLEALGRQVVRLMEFRKLSIEFKQLSEHYLKLYANSPIAEVIIDNEGIVTSANQSAATLLGQPLEWITGRSALFESLNDESKAAIAQWRERFEESGQSSGMPLTMKRPDGSAVYVLANALQLVDREKKTAGAHVTLQDVTKLREYERELESARQLAESANRAKSEFLAVMSHEIRTPLNGIIGMVGILKDTPLASDQKRYLDIVERSGSMLMHVIGNVLDFSKLQADAMEISETVFDLRATLSEVVDLFTAQATEKNLELKLAIDPRLPHRMISDQGKLRQIVINLVSNALKFTEKGRVTISATLAEKTETALRMKIAVEDSGIGMTPEQKAKLFQPFSQADSSISRRFGGTGLGLSICKELTELLNGTIRVDSQTGTGSTFYFEIPTQYDLGSALMEQPGQESLLAGRRVLIVDNLAVNLEILTTHLKNLGIEPTALADSREAVAVARDQQFDIAILDLNMPDMNGAELAALLKVVAPKTIRLLLSSIAVIEDQEIKELFHRTLTRPLSRETLKQTLLHFLTRSPEPAAKPKEPLKGKTVLIVEDDAINQMISRITVEKFGAIAELAPDAGEALAAVEKRNYDLVLLDLHLPDMSGLDLAPQLQKIKPGLKIVAFTADITLLSDARLKEFGIIDKISKPVTLADFSEFLSKANWL